MYGFYCHVFPLCLNLENLGQISCTLIIQCLRTENLKFLKSTYQQLEHLMNCKESLGAKRRMWSYSWSSTLSSSHLSGRSYSFLQPKITSRCKLSSRWMSTLLLATKNLKIKQLDVHLCLCLHKSGYNIFVLASICASFKALIHDFLNFKLIYGSL